MQHLALLTTKPHGHAPRGASPTKRCLAVGALALFGTTSLLQAQGGWSDEFDRPGLHGGGVWAVDEYQGELIVGGDGPFEADGQNLGLVARFDGTRWQALGSGVTGNAVTAIGGYQGELVVAGQFNRAGGLLVGNIARWDGTRWRSLGSGLNWWVYALAEYQGELYAAGEFTLAGGQAVNHIARWDGTQWRPVGGGLDKQLAPQVWALVVGADNRLYASGEFTSAGGAPIDNVAVWDGTSWGPIGGGLPGPGNGRVFDLEWYQGKLYAASNFDLIPGGFNEEKLAVWDGTSWSAAGVFPDTTFGTSVSALQTVGTDLYAAGNFLQASGVSAKRIARFDGTQWFSTGGIQDDSPTGSKIRDMSVVGGKLIVGGNFFWAGFNFVVGQGTAVDNVASFDGTAWASVGTGLGFDEFNRGAVLWNGNPVVIGGAFKQAGSQFIGPPALFNGTDWAGLGDFSAFSGSVDAAIVDQGDLVVAGKFSSVDGQPVNDVARFDGTQWSGFGASPFCCGVDALAVYQGQLYAGGLGGVERWTGTSWQSFGPQIIGAIVTLYVHQNVLYIGGSMPSFGNLVSWDGSTQQTVGGGTNGIVYALMSFQGELLVGGSFTTAGGAPANRLARWDGNAFTAFPGITGTLVNTLAVFQGELHVGGQLFSIGTPMSHIARWDGSSWQALGGGIDGVPWALLPDDAGERLWVAGGFGHADGRLSRNFALWETAGAVVCQEDVGFAGPGTATLSICGQALATGGTADLLLDSSLPGAFALIGYGSVLNPIPLLGGTIVPLPLISLQTTVTDSAGDVFLPGITGGGGPFDLYIQGVVIDPAQPAGFQITNAVKMHFLP